MNIARIDGPGARYAPPPPEPPKQYEVRHGDSLDGIAQAHGTTVQKLMAANPEVVNPEVIYPGQQLDLPRGKATVEASGDEIGLTPKHTTKTGTEANGTTATTSGGVNVTGDGVSVTGSQSGTTTQTGADGHTRSSGTSSNGSVKVDPDKGTVSVSGGSGFTEGVKNSKGYGVSFGVDANATVVAGKHTENGVTTYTASSDVSVSLKVGVDAKQAGLEVGHTEGIKGSFEVSMPEQIAKTTNLATVNPFDPDSMPTGTVIKLDSASYSGNEFKATFRNIAAQTKVTNEAGTSLLVEKTGTDLVKVTAGPTEAIAAYNGVGVDAGVASVMLGRNDKLDSATLKTAQFNLASADGRAAYNDFVANGQMPADNGAGVSGVATIEKLDFSSQTKLDAKLGPLSLGLDGPKNTGNSVVTTAPDGSIERTVDLQYSGNVPMTVSQKFDATGKEVIGERQYTYTIKADANTAQLINTAQTGNVENAVSGPVQDGDTVVLSYSEADMAALLGHAQKSLEASQGMDSDLRILTQDYDGKAVSALDFALGLARNLGGSDYGTASRLFNISSGADGQIADNGYVQLPGQVSVTGRTG